MAGMAEFGAQVPGLWQYESRHGNKVTKWVEAIAVKSTWVDQWLKQNSGESLIWYGGIPDT